MRLALRIVPLLLCAAACAPADGGIRLAANAILNGWMRDTGAGPAEQAVIADKRAALDYYRALGYTHILYGLERPYSPLFQKRGGEWEYHGGDYAGGDHALSLAAMKKAVESRGMI